MIFKSRKRGLWIWRKKRVFEYEKEDLESMVEFHESRLRDKVFFTEDFKFCLNLKKKKIVEK